MGIVANVFIRIDNEDPLSHEFRVGVDAGARRADIGWSQGLSDLLD